MSNATRPLSKDGSVHVTDEVFNTASHLVGAMASLTGWVVLVVQASVEQDAWRVVGFSIYGLTLFCLFLASTLHHGLNGSEAFERRLKLLDYHAIALLIAGTFTPLAFVLRTPLSWSLWGVCCALAVAGITLKSAVPALPKWVSSTLYVGMGMLAAPLLGQITSVLGWGALLWLLLGALFYAGGAVVYSIERPNPHPGRFGFHEIWHLLVMGGALCHFLMMYWTVL